MTLLCSLLEFIFVSLSFILSGSFSLITSEGCFTCDVIAVIDKNDDAGCGGGRSRVKEEAHTLIQSFVFKTGQRSQTTLMTGKLGAPF